MTERPKIFISYSHKNTNVADSIDESFKKIGVSFTRDVRDLGMRGSIKEFMEKIRENGFALLIISDEFLRSRYCMYEAIELLKERNFKDKVLPIILENAGIFEPREKIKYIKYWNNEHKELKKELDGIEREYSVELSKDLKLMDKIRSSIDEFMGIIGDMKHIPLGILKANNYKEILELIGFDEKLFNIASIENSQEKEKKLDNYIKENPEDAEAFFTKAYSADENKEFDKAREYYEKAIKINSKYVDAYNNLGLLLTNDYFKEYKAAEEYYEKVIMIDPKYSKVYFNLGILYQNNFQDYDKAKVNYKKAIKINTKYGDAYYNLAILHDENFHDYFKSKEYYEKLIKLDPKYVDAYCNLGVLYQNNFQDYDKAKEYYEKALKLNPKYALVLYNLAILFEYRFNESGKAKNYYLEAISLNPQYKSEEFDKLYGV